MTHPNKILRADYNSLGYQLGGDDDVDELLSDLQQKSLTMSSGHLCDRLEELNLYIASRRVSWHIHESCQGLVGWIVTLLSWKVVRFDANEQHIVKLFWLLLTCLINMQCRHELEEDETELIVPLLYQVMDLLSRDTLMFDSHARPSKDLCRALLDTFGKNVSEKTKNTSNLQDNSSLVDARYAHLLSGRHICLLESTTDVLAVDAMRAYLGVDTTTDMHSSIDTLGKIVVSEGESQRAVVASRCLVAIADQSISNEMLLRALLTIIRVATQSNAYPSMFYHLLPGLERYGTQSNLCKIIEEYSGDNIGVALAGLSGRLVQERRDPSTRLTIKMRNVVDQVLVTLFPVLLGAAETSSRLSALFSIRKALETIREFIMSAHDDKVLMSMTQNLFAWLPSLSSDGLYRFGRSLCNVLAVLLTHAAIADEQKTFIGQMLGELLNRSVGFHGVVVQNSELLLALADCLDARRSRELKSAVATVVTKLSDHVMNKKQLSKTPALLPRIVQYARTVPAESQDRLHLKEMILQLAAAL